MSFKIPESIQDATPHSFQITKNDLADPEKEMKAPEGYVSVIIRDWVFSITSEQMRQENPAAWEHYPNHFGANVVLDNDSFPTSLPIGYVLVCFLLSCKPTIYRRKKIKKYFNDYIQYEGVRSSMFEDYKKGKFSVLDLSDEPFREPDNLELGSSLYQDKSEQTNLFND